MKKIKRFAICFLIAFLLAGTVSHTNAEAALKIPTNCRFTRWNNSTFTACRISWNKVSGASYYEINWSWLDGSHASRRYQYGRYNVLDIKGLSNTRVYKVKVRALKTGSSGKIREYGKWSNVSYITPLPRSVKMTLKKSGHVKISWTRIHGSHGYQIYLTTNPAGKWYSAGKTAKKSSATSFTIRKYRGSALKKRTNYYIRVVPLVKHNKKYRNVYVKARFYQGGFALKTVTK